LLKAWGEAYCAAAGCRLDWIKAGTGAAMKLLESRQVDMVMVHAPEQEKAALAAGWATASTLIGSNEFFIVGPAADPAGIAGAADALDAYRRVVSSDAKWVSRGDNSGTHQKEMSLWQAAGVMPVGKWYLVTHDFMTASLQRAEREGAYFMTDSSTWVAEERRVPGLKILFRGDRRLVNTYHALLAPAGATAGHDTAAAFIRFVASAAGQQMLRDFGRAEYGASLYDDAAYAARYVAP
ncbi:MAG TPA: substrate-binding domain-containing protein, partial [Rhodocyclaceae bacterium]|nr:substrate-binding domain-containing protein [Rhodocyclaceae bacterium]